MIRWGALLVGTAVGALAALTVAYLFGPAPDAPYDSGYRSRLDDALDQGQAAAEAKEAELRSRYGQLRAGAPGKESPAA